MDFLKRYDKMKFRRRYARYRKLFFLSFFLFLLGVVLEMSFFGTGGRSVQLLSPPVKEHFLSLFTVESIPVFLSFLFGITLYAPFFHFLFSLIRGALTGYVLSCALLSGQGFLFFLLVFLYLLLSSQICFSYSAFCTCVALRLYTDKALSVRAEEKRMFGGSLFQSSFFCGVINLRFLLLYTAFFVLALLVFAVLSLFFSFALSLF